MKRTLNITQQESDQNHKQRRFSFYQPIEEQNVQALQINEIVWNDSSALTDAPFPEKVVLNQQLALSFRETQHTPITIKNTSPKLASDFLRFAEKGDIKALRQLWDRVVDKHYFNALQSDAALIASVKNHFHVLDFLIKGVKFIILDREPTTEEKLTVINGSRIFAIIDTTKLPKKSTGNLAEATITFRDKEYKYQTRKLNSTENSGLLANIKIAYFNEMKSAQKESREIQPINPQQKKFNGPLKSFLNQHNGDSTGLAYHDVTMNPAICRTAIIDAYCKMNLDLFDMWLNLDSDFTRLSALEPHQTQASPLYHVKAMQYLFMSLAEKGDLDKIKIMAQCVPLDQNTVNMALLFAVENEHLSIIEYLPMQGLPILKRSDLWNASDLHPDCLIYRLTHTLTTDFNKSVSNKITILNLLKNKDKAIFETLIQSFIYCILYLRNADLHFDEEKVLFKPVLGYLLSDINPHDNTLGMPDVGLNLAINTNNVELFKALVISYDLYSTPKMKQYYEKVLNNDKHDEMRVVAKIAMVSAYSNNYKKHIFLDLSQNSKNYTQLIDRFLNYFLKQFSNNESIDCSLAIQELLDEPLLFKVYSSVRWHELLQQFYSEIGSNTAKELSSWIDKKAVEVIKGQCFELFKLYSQINADIYSFFPSDIIQVIFDFAVAIAPLDNQKQLNAVREESYSNRKLRLQEQQDQQFMQQLNCRITQGLTQLQKQETVPSISNYTSLTFFNTQEPGLDSNDRHFESGIYDHEMEVESNLALMHNPYLIDLEIPIGSDDSSDDEFLSLFEY